MKIQPGHTLRRRVLSTVASGQVQVPDPERIIHLQFRRFAGCPFCSLHLQSFIKRRAELLSAGILPAAVFYSSPEALAPYFGDVPLAVIPDPRKELYVEFGVEASLRAVLDPRAWLPALRGVLAEGLRVPRAWTGETPLGLPADFLIASDGKVLASKYGSHAYDQWTVNEVLALANIRPSGR